MAKHGWQVRRGRGGCEPYSFFSRASMWLYQRVTWGNSLELGALTIADQTDRSSRDAWYLQQR